MIQTQAPGPKEADGSCSSGSNFKGRVSVLFIYFFLNIVSSILVYKYFSQIRNLGLSVCVDSTLVALGEFSHLGIRELTLKNKSRQP